ncbi:UNVERIFIED_CONTAM: hypothetical protein Sradi_1759800 [Sesamum radiatum]|uniref:Uncharacterized protein n=1 Tax=Sesamum radiatum TaxID=300843 RepID=A0AAW2TUN9_SESRA
MENTHNHKGHRQTQLLNPTKATPTKNSHRGFNSQTTSAKTQLNHYNKHGRLVTKTTKNPSQRPTRNHKGFSNRLPEAISHRDFYRRKPLMVVRDKAAG